MKSPSRNIPKCLICLMDVVALVELRSLHVQLDSRAYHVIYHAIDIFWTKKYNIFICVEVR
jgi:hypothetical protein